MTIAEQTEHVISESRVAIDTGLGLRPSFDAAVAKPLVEMASNGSRAGDSEVLVRTTRAATDWCEAFGTLAIDAYEERLEFAGLTRNPDSVRACIQAFRKDMAGLAGRWQHSLRERLRHSEGIFAEVRERLNVTGAVQQAIKRLEPRLTSMQAKANLAPSANPTPMPNFEEKDLTDISKRIRALRMHAASVPPDAKPLAPTYATKLVKLLNAPASEIDFAAVAEATRGLCLACAHQRVSGLDRITNMMWSEVLDLQRKPLELLMAGWPAPDTEAATESTPEPMARKILIGHGHSGAWKDLDRFLRDKLLLETVEFNSQATAGLSTKERLETMLSECGIGFLVLTGEDEGPDGKLHARQSVVHEVGLCQGRYGFTRGIVLLEEGCAEFSNIVGISQIRFPMNNIKAASEEIREVLQREGWLP